MNQLPTSTWWAYRTCHKALDESVATAGENRQAESAEFQASWHR